MLLNFTKMHGLGNDFMVLDLISKDSPKLSSEQIKRLADRHRGVGFDQLLLIKAPSNPDVDFDYRIYNADGSEVEHCGNGARCFALYVREKGLSLKNPVWVQTVNRRLKLSTNSEGLVTVDMGEPRLSPKDLPFNDGQTQPRYQRIISVNGQQKEVEFSIVSMGNPHAVIVVDDIDTAAVEEIGHAVGSHADFPDGVNVGFMQILAANHIRLRVYERGAGETLACGTGACAAVVAGCHLGRLDGTVTVDLLGGQLEINWQQTDGPVLMTGPASNVYEGKIQL